jgi:hypothetical protein
MNRDRYGLPFSTSSLAAATAYLDGMDRLLAADAGAGVAMQNAVSFDPGFALAHAGLARAQQIAGNTPEAKASASEAVRLSEGLCAREMSHTRALHAVVNGAPNALEQVRTHINDFPRDALVLAPGVAVFGLIGFSGRKGRNEELFTWMTALAPHYADDWWFGAWFGFLHTETGRFSDGRAIVERAYAINPRNANAAHALAHVCYEHAEAADGISFLNEWLPRYAPAAPLHCHLSWHQAVFELEAGSPQLAWKLYNQAVCPTGSPLAPPMNTLTDSAAFLWRASLLGQSVPAASWSETNQFALDRFPTGGVDFVDAHAVMAAIGAGDSVALEMILQRLRSGSGKTDGVLTQISEALEAYGQGNWQRAIDLIAGKADELIRIGGSGAQRDVFEHTLISAYFRAGRADDARAWLASRPPRPRNRNEQSLLRLAR